jgi:hypothetical protein
MMKTFSAAFTVCLICFSATVTFADQYVRNHTPIPPEAIAAWRAAAAAHARSNGTYVDPYCHRSGLNGNVHIECHGPTMHFTGTVGSSNQPLDGPGNREDITGEGEPHYHRDPNSVRLCPPPHFSATAASPSAEAAIDGWVAAEKRCKLVKYFAAPSPQ